MEFGSLTRAGHANRNYEQYMNFAPDSRTTEDPVLKGDLGRLRMYRRNGGDDDKQTNTPNASTQREAYRSVGKT